MGSLGGVLFNTLWEFWCLMVPKVCNISVSTKIKLLNLKEFDFALVGICQQLVATKFSQTNFLSTTILKVSSFLPKPIKNFSKLIMDP